MVDILCRFNRELATRQKQRDDSRRSLGRACDPARIKDTDQMSAIQHERFYSHPPKDSSLVKPDVPPLLPPVPTSSILAEGDREDAELRQADHTARFLATMQALSGKTQIPFPGGAAVLAGRFHEPPASPFQIPNSILPDGSLTRT